MDDRVKRNALSVSDLKKLPMRVPPFLTTKNLKKMNKPILIVGDKGTGKTFISEIMAELFDNDNVKRIRFENLTENLTEFSNTSAMRLFFNKDLWIVDECIDAKYLVPILPLIKNFPRIHFVFLLQASIDFTIDPLLKEKVRILNLNR